MKQPGLFILIMCFCCINCIAQDNDEVLIHIPKTGKSVTDFIPKWYDTLAVARSDFNKDGKIDIAMVLHDVREDTALMGTDVRNSNRIMVVLLKTSDDWKLAVKSNELVMCKDCGGVFGDPFAGIEVSGAVITINHYGGSAERWALSRKFRYQHNDFYLIGKTDDNTWINEMCDSLEDMPGDHTDINLITGDRERKKISRDCKILLDKKDQIKKMPLIKMADYKYEN